MELTAKFNFPYRSKKTGTKTSCYTVTGTPEALAQYKEDKGEFFVQDEKTGEVLYFDTTTCAKEITIHRSATGNWSKRGNDELDFQMQALENQINQLDPESPMARALSAKYAELVVANM